MYVFMSVFAFGHHMFTVFTVGDIYNVLKLDVPFYSLF